MVLRRPVLVFWLMGASAGLAGCGLKERVRRFLQGDERRDVVVRVGEVQYTQSDLDRFFDSRLSDFRDPAQADRVKSKLLDSFVEEKLLLREAEGRGIEPDPEALRGMVSKLTESAADRDKPGAGVRDAELERSVRDSLKMQRYLHDVVLKDVKVDAAECEEYYLKHLGDYIRNDVVHVREILVGGQAQAEKILDSLKANKNKNFAELARAHSLAPSAADGGDLGTFSRGDLPEEFEKAIYSLAPGTVSKIVRTAYGLHIFMVEEKILAHQQKLFEVQDEIEEKLLTERQRGRIDAEIDALMKRIPIDVHPDRLGFYYVGTRLGGVSHD
jgi:parvulin-like peptidyl-prolyl isomerase